MSSAVYDPDNFGKALFYGVMEAWATARDFTGDLDTEVWPEYLVTVSLAQELSKQRTDWDNIGLEVETNELVRLALCGRQPIVQLTRRGRVDLALYEKGGLGRPVYLVEVKDAVLNHSEAIEDVVRIEEFLLLASQAKPSSIKMGALVLLIRKKDTRIHEDVLQGAAVKSASTMQKQLENKLSTPSVVGVKWLISAVSNTAKPRIPTAADWDEEGGPAITGDEQFTLALIGVFYRKTDYPLSSSDASGRPSSRSRA